MKWHFTFFLILAFVAVRFEARAQNPEFDKLEMLFDQRHYKKVYRKSRRLMDKPEYDYSLLPKYYKSLSGLQLCQNEHWLLRHPHVLEDSKELFLEVKRDKDAEKLFASHKYELTWVKNELVAWAADLKRRGKKDEFESVQEIIDVLFENIDDLDDMPDGSTVVNPDTTVVENPDFRDEIIITAKQHLGTPYVWAGSAPGGFDCSGFTSYVMKENGKSLPRRAVDQYESSQKIKEKHVQKGDLVFFDNGSGISHVGIVISEKGEPLTMIHSASSKGIIITDITKSEYWTKRLHGFGTYVTE
ncbi:MAG: C40 family peptidase [bacterium]|nr:C40 family peptidase [bacterium]